MAKYIRIPFAQLGDKATIPDLPTAGLELNYTTGYTAAYEADPDIDPAARYVERDGQNQIFFVLSSNIKEWQEHIYPSFITAAENGGSPLPYEKGMIVRYLGLNYISLESSNQDTPPSSKWEEYVIGTAARREVGTSAGEIPDTGILNTRLGTSGNLGNAAERTVGSALANLPDNAELNTRLATTGNLGDAAQRTVQSAIVDTTANRVMINGAHGLGGIAPYTVNFNTVNETRFIGSPSPANAPEGTEITNGVSVESPVVGDFTTQIVVVHKSQNVYHRSGSGDWFTPVPPGTNILFAGSVPPNGYFERNGSAVSRAIYSGLFDAIGTTYGAGDGSTTFNIPNDTDPNYLPCIKY